MFKTKRLAGRPSVTDTLIGEGTSLDGKLVAEGDIRIEGRVTGAVESRGDVTVGEQGAVLCDIRARNVIIAGAVHGNIFASGNLRLTSTGQLFGNVTAESFAALEGAVFHGLSRVTGHLQSEDPQMRTEGGANVQTENPGPPASSIPTAPPAANPLASGSASSSVTAEPTSMSAKTSSTEDTVAAESKPEQDGTRKTGSLAIPFGG